MALTAWKAFQFFETTGVNFPDEDVASLFTQSKFSCLCPGSDNLFVAGTDGAVRIISKAFKVIRSFDAHDTGQITHMKQVEGTSLLVTVSEDMSSEPVLKVWALDKIEKKSNTPRCTATLSIQNGRKPFPISAFAALDNFSQLAFGFANGAVTLIRGDLIHDRGTRQRTVFESEDPVTGVEFYQGSSTALYISTTARVLVLAISGRGQGQPARTLDENGCSVGCMTVDRETRDVVVARDDAVYYYGLHGRGSIYNCDGQKKLLKTYKDYVTLSFPAATSSISLGKLGIGSTSNGDTSRSQAVTILNTDFSFIAHTDLLAAEVQTCFSEWGDLFILTVDGKIRRYHEKALQQKFDILFQRDYYVLAIQIAQKSGMSTSQQSFIYRKYGDFLYQKKDYDTAMQQYLRAIDGAEPSQVIRKYLDTQRIHNLIDYLEELHEHGKATSDHTILLLNCYAKLKDVDKLEAFIKTPGDLKFDLDVAIDMCRQGGYFDQAAYLARKHSEHDIVISVLIEDSKRYSEALAYIWRLEPEDAFRNLSKYAVVLLEHCSEDATQLFIDYYTGKFRPKKDTVVVTTSSYPQAQPTNVAVSAVQNLAALLPLPYMNMPSKEEATEQRTETRIVESTNDEPPAQYEVPRPRTAFAAFVDHPKELVAFLEACIASPDLSQADKIDLYTTLFEMYLRARNEEQDEDSTWLSKAKQLIESKDIPIDTSNVLLLSHLEKFHDGTALVREQQGLSFDIFRSYTTAKDTAGAIKALRKYGPNEPQLYPAALAYFTSSPKILEEAGSEVEAVLNKIQEDRLMAPLQVIQTLSTNDVATMGLVKSYLRDTVGKERKEISNNRKTITAYRGDTASKRQELSGLISEPSKFTNTRCNSCGYALEQPAVHFMCQHSFHQRCLNISEGETVDNIECPQCAPQNATIRAIKESQYANKDRHDLFLAALSNSKDGFGTVAEWFGRGVMNVPTTD